MISVCFQGKPFNIIVIQVYAPTTNAEEAEVEQFYEDVQDLTPTEMPRQEYYSRLPFPFPGDLPDPGIKPMSSALVGRFLLSEPPGSP